MSVLGKHRGRRMRATRRHGRKDMPRPATGARRKRHVADTDHFNLDAYATPVLRVGCLVNATVGDPPRVRTFNYAEGERAAPLLDKSKRAFHDNLLAAVDEIREQEKIPIKVLPRDNRFEKAKRARALGMVYHLAEFSLEVRGVAVLVLASATLCVQLDAATSKGPPPNSEDVAYSKFWIRFFAPPPDAGIGGAKNAKFSLDEIERFRDDLSPLADRMLERMLKPYQAMLRKLSRDNTLTVKPSARFEVLAAASMAGDFPKLFSALRSGLNLRSQLSKCLTARQIVDLELRNEKESGPGKKPDRRTFLAKLSRPKHPKTRFYIYETPNSYRAVFFRYMAEKDQVRFVGLTDRIDPPERGDEGDNTLKALKRLAPNAVTSNLVTDLGGLF